MYVDVKDLLQKTQQIRKAAEAGTPVSSQAQTTHQFTPAIETDKSHESSQTSDQVKSNLERLQSLHHKLHAMLEELNKLNGKKS